MPQRLNHLRQPGVEPRESLLCRGDLLSSTVVLYLFGLLAGGFPRVVFPPLWCFPPAVSGWGSVWVGVTPRDDLASTGFHDCHQRTVRQPRPTRPRLATGARPSVPHHHPIRPRRVRTTSRPTSWANTHYSLVTRLVTEVTRFGTRRAMG